MAHIDKRAEHRYRVRYRDRIGRERSKTFTRRCDARRFKSVVEDELARGTWVDPRAGKAPLRKFAAEVMAHKINVRPSTSDRLDAYLRNQVLPGFGELALNKIDRFSVQAWVNQLTQVLAPRTVRDAYRVLSQLLGEAERQNLIRLSPCHRITLPIVPRTEPRYLAPDQVERLARAIDPRFRALIIGDAFLGLRWSELAGLKRVNVDLSARRIRVVGALHKVGSSWGYTTQLKTVRSRRSLALAPFITELLAEHLAVAPPSEFVFSSPKGGILAYGNFRKRFWDPAVAHAELDDVTPHALRHTCVALMIAEGANPLMVQRQLGHADLRMTLGTYGHLFPHWDDDLADRMQQCWLKTKSAQHAACARPDTREPAK